MTKKKQSLKLPIFLIVGPTLGIILTVFLYAVLNFVFSGYAPDDSSMGGIEAGASVAQGGDDGASMFRTISNIFLFILGSVSILAILPSLIFGVYLLSKRRKYHVSDKQTTKNNDSRGWGDLE